MKNIMQLRRERASLVDQAQTYLDNVEKEGRAWGEDDEAEFKKIMDSIEELTKTEERQAKLEGFRPAGDLPQATREDPEDEPKPTPQKSGFRSLGEFLYTIKRNPNDKRLVPADFEERAGLNESSDGAGGYTVPEEFRPQLLAMQLESSVIRPNGATVIPMGTDTINIPKVVDTAHTSTLFGGVVAYWTEEGGTLTVKEPTFGQIKLIAKTLTGYTYASNQLLADNAVGLAALLTRMFGGALGWYEDDAFIDGDGVGKPLGILNSGALLAVNRSAASTVAIADLASVLGRVLPSSLGRGVWLANPGVLAQLIKLGSTYLTWIGGGPGDLTKAMPSTLLGRPIFYTEKCEALGTAGDIVFADLSYYLIGDREQIAVASSEHVRFTTNETAWRFIKRVDGQPWVDSAFTPANGSSLSPFVTLHSTTNGGD